MLMTLMMTLAVPIRGGIPPSCASTTRLYLGRREGKGEGVRGRRCERRGKRRTEEWSDGKSERVGRQREGQRGKLGRWWCM